MKAFGLLTVVVVALFSSRSFAEFGALMGDQKRFTSHCDLPDACYELSYMGMAYLESDPNAKKGECKKLAHGPCEKTPFVCGYAIGVDEDGQMEFRYYSATAAPKYRKECNKKVGPTKQLDRMLGASAGPSMIRELGPRKSE